MDYIYLFLLLILFILWIKEIKNYLKLKNDIALKEEIEAKLKDNRNKKQKQEQFNIMSGRKGNKEVILLLDDDQDILNLITTVLNKHNFITKPFYNPLKALKYFEINSNNVNIIITDYSMPEMNGIEFIKKLKKLNKDIPIIVFTGYSYVNVGKDIKKLISKVLIKPTPLIKIVESVLDVLNEHKKR